MAMPSAQKITLVSSDGYRFQIDVAIAQISQILKYVIEDVGIVGEFPLPNVSGKILAKVIEYCQKHAEHEASAGDEDKKKLEEWDAEFLNVDFHETMPDLISAANYLDIKSLFDLTCRAAGNAIKGKTTEQMRELMRVKNDYTPEEEAQLWMENYWAV